MEGGKEVDVVLVGPGDGGFSAGGLVFARKLSGRIVRLWCATAAEYNGMLPVVCDPLLL